MMDATTAESIESLRPQREGMIMDMVAEAGIDVSQWSVKKDGSPVLNPRANPNYCYEWAFGGNGEPTALCIWHPSLKVSQGAISYEDSLRQYALELDRLAIDRTNPSHVKSRARDQAKRARNFDSLLQHAFRKSKPVRAIVLLGEARAAAALGWETSKVKYRSLDPEQWYVHSYSDDDGTFRLVRSVPLATATIPAAPESTTPVFVDQFSLPESGAKNVYVGTAFARSPAVRQAVLLRGNGVCECCGQPGFRMDTGAVFLETHHVIPLSEGGPDVEWNVVAICPNDHRRAHFWDERKNLRSQLVAKLTALYPLAESALQALLDGKPNTP
jgi:5-methylcytosine-specific restriction protein A